MVLFAPVDAAVGDVGVDGGPDGGMEAVGSELLEEPVASEPVFDRVFDLGEMELDTGGGEVVVQALEDVGGGGVDVGDWFGGDHDPPGRCR